MRRLTRPSWLIRHVIMVALVVVFLRLGWWQLSRAEGGNALSIGYTLEWPAFALFVIIVWWREVRMALRGSDDSARVRQATPSDGAAVPDIPGVSQFDVDAARAERDARIEQTLAASSTAPPRDQGSQRT
jgi:hypothetical protein